MSHPAILRNLLEQYKTLLVQGTEKDDVTYILCVSTGTLTIEAAPTVAHQQLAASLTEPPPTRAQRRATCSSLPDSPSAPRATTRFMPAQELFRRAARYV
ncbi:DUF5133 domain-containing protein [Streptomyces sp. NPDC058695]|uniref:DUF5133 domain-containing protein n=1 Tax=Streptomyces sp. NPDC058695 TaxID=3346604 RepID=UPI00365B0BE3